MGSAILTKRRILTSPLHIQVHQSFETNYSTSTSLLHHLIISLVVPSQQLVRFCSHLASSTSRTQNSSSKMKLATLIATIALNFATTTSAYTFLAGNATHGLKYPATNAVYHHLTTTVEYDSVPRPGGIIFRAPGSPDTLSTIVAFLFDSSFAGKTCEFMFELQFAFQGQGQLFDVFESTNHTEHGSDTPTSNYRGKYMGRMKAVGGNGQATVETGNFVFPCPHGTEEVNAVYQDYEVTPVGMQTHIQWNKQHGPWMLHNNPE